MNPSIPLNTLKRASDFPETAERKKSKIALSETDRNKLQEVIDKTKNDCSGVERIVKIKAEVLLALGSTGQRDSITIIAEKINEQEDYKEYKLTNDKVTSILKSFKKNGIVCIYTGRRYQNSQAIQEKIQKLIPPVVPINTSAFGFPPKQLKNTQAAASDTSTLYTNTQISAQQTTQTSNDKTKEQEMPLVILNDPTAFTSEETELLKSLEEESNLPLDWLL